MGGPYIKAALLCDQVIEGKDNVLSLIRVVDTVAHTEAGPNAPDVMPAFSHALKLVIMLVAGDAVGRHELRIDLLKPNGLRQTGAVLPVQFLGVSTGTQHMILEMNLAIELEGPYWFEIFLDSDTEPVTKVPLRIIYQRIPTPGVPQS